MDIFISWSGPQSLGVAEALRRWIPKVINAAKPFLSAEDIDKGTRWSSEIAGRLEKAKAGIICLTAENINSQWIIFEAGALSKTVEKTYVCPLLIGLKPSDIKGPLAQFQFTSTGRGDMLKMFKTLNAALDEAALSNEHIEEAFDLVWPKLETQLKATPASEVKAARRSEPEILDEILELIRGVSRRIPGQFEPPKASPEHLRGEVSGGIIAEMLQESIKEFHDPIKCHIGIRDNRHLLKVDTIAGFSHEFDTLRPATEMTTAEFLDFRRKFSNAYRKWRMDE